MIVSHSNKIVVLSYLSGSLLSRYIRLKKLWVTFTTPLANAAYTLMLTDHTTAGGAKASKLAGSFTITCTGATDTVDYLVLGNPY